MKTIRRTQMQAFEASNLSEFADRFNSVLDWVGRTAVSYKEPVVDMNALRGYVMYETVERLAEGYRDALELNNQSVTCGQCKHFTPIRYSYGACPYCKGDLRKADEACEKMFKAWENGDCWLNEGEEEQYGKALDELRCTSIRYVKRADVG